MSERERGGYPAEERANHGDSVSERPDGLEEFEDEPLKKTVKQHEKRAEMVLDLEEKVADVVNRLKEHGLTSPYLRTFVVARINPLRWIKGEPPPLEEVLKTMKERASKFNVEKIRPQDLASMAGAPPDTE